MALKKSFLNFQFGNKGVIFLLDIVIALFIVLIILSISSFYLSRSEESPITKLQASRIANDIFAVLDYNGLLSEFDRNKIRNEIELMLPEGYSIDFKINCPNRVFDSRQNKIDNYIFAGERIFKDNQLNNCIVRYWIWLD